MQSSDGPINVTLVSQSLRSSVTVTLQWLREAGAVYGVSVLPEISSTELTTLTHDIDICTINLTVSYNVQYNVSIVSSLCNVTTIRVLHYGELLCMHEC